MLSLTRKLRPILLASGLIVAGFAVLPVPASAAAPETFRQEISDTSTHDYLTELCRTTVVVSQSGTAVVTIWRNKAGLVIREHDRYPGATLTFSAPDTGRSVTMRLQADTTWDYGAGATLGSDVLITARGLMFHVPGETSAFAGNETYRATVDGFDENGVPLNNDGADFVRFVGHQPDVDVPAAVCRALTG